MKKSLLAVFAVIGSCLVARAADQNANKAADPTTSDSAQHVIVTNVKKAATLPAAAGGQTADPADSYNITVFESTDPKTKKLNINTATADEVKAVTDNKPVKLVITTTNAAKTTPFSGKIVRVQAMAGNRTEIFTLENVRLTSLLGNEFIVGTAVKYGNDRFSGLEVYLNLRLVLTIVAMTPEQAKHFNESRQPRSGQGPSNPPQQGNNPPQGPYNPPRGPYVPLPGQGPYNPPSPFSPPAGQGFPQPGFNPPPGLYPQQGQGPYTPPQGYNPPPGTYPQPPGQGPFNPSQGYVPPTSQGPFTPPPGWNPPPSGQPQGNNPPQGYYPPQGGQGPNMPGNNPQQGSPSGPKGQ